MSKIKKVWTLDMPHDQFRENIRQLVSAELAGITVGRLTFENETDVFSIGIEGTTVNGLPQVPDQ